MKKRVRRGVALFLPLITLLVSAPAIAATCDRGFSPALPGEQPLIKRGSGTARYLMFRVYDAALYTPAGNGGSIDTATGPLCLEICYHRALDSQVIVEAANKVLQEQNDPLTLALMAPQVKQLHGAYQAVTEGDRYRLCREDTTRLTLSLNGRPLKTVTGSAIAERYLDIWLGDRPLSQSLRDNLLARP